jgi:hypothetical protein
MRKISHNTYLQALGLFTLGRQHVKKADDCREAIDALLDLSPFGHVSDALYDGETERDFDAALMLEDIEVERN